jgi:hypothetical protein
MTGMGGVFAQAVARIVKKGCEWTDSSGGDEIVENCEESCVAAVVGSVVDNQEREAAVVVACGHVEAIVATGRENR